MGTKRSAKARRRTTTKDLAVRNRRGVKGGTWTVQSQPASVRKEIDRTSTPLVQATSGGAS